jgi:hypothetical protein
MILTGVGAGLQSLVAPSGAVVRFHLAHVSITVVVRFVQRFWPSDGFSILKAEVFSPDGEAAWR